MLIYCLAMELFSKTVGYHASGYLLGPANVFAANVPRDTLPRIHASTRNRSPNSRCARDAASGK